MMSSTRKYASPGRDAEAAKTRARIVDSAARLFVRDGYAATSLRAIATAAEVSVQSVHLAGPKLTLLMAGLEKTFAGDEGSHSLTERAEVAEILAMPDTTIAVDHYVAFLVRANQRAASMWRVLRATADSDARVRAAVSALDGRRRADLLLGAHWLIDRGLLELGRLEEGADVLGFLTSPDTYIYFVEDSGWTSERFEKWLRGSIDRMVLDS